MSHGRSLPRSIDELIECNISTECPHCGDTVALVPVHSPTNTHDNAYFVAQCPNHKRQHCRPIFAVYQALNDCIVARYPISTAEASNFHKSIPMPIREDYAEACRCAHNNANKAVVVMCRRVIEALACDKLQGKAKDGARSKALHLLVDLLQSEGFITKDLKESAHELRLFGNYGAHVQDDGLDNVTPKEAKNAREITWQLLHTIYVAPAKTAELRDARRAKEQS